MFASVLAPNLTALLPLLCAMLLAVGCVTLPRHAGRVHAVAAGPSADQGLPVLTGLRDPAGREQAETSRGKGERGAARQDDVVGPQASADPVADPDGSVQAAGADAADRPAALPLSMVPARGTARARVVASARRLVGVVRSFDERSFLGHMLIINDVLPKGASSATYTAASHRDQARRSGALLAADQALPGDVVVFPCSSGCGAGAADGVAAGIVEEWAAGTLRFIAYVEGEVRACAWGKSVGDAFRVRKVEGVVRTWP